ncbi:MAG: hypothetical protein AAF696_23320, partial [Bacteroidota bacterium]
LFYILRFYFRPKQDVFAVLKLLLVLLFTILAIVNLTLIEDENTHIFSAITFLILSLLLPGIHTLDMVLWEKQQSKKQQNMETLDDLIDKISGN